jgi:hypothetical protein
MTSLSLRASDVPNVPHIWSSFARVGSVLGKVLDVFAEAELGANAAHKKLSLR